MLPSVKQLWQNADGFGKRGWLYSFIGLIGLYYALIFDQPIKWFAVIIWFFLLCLGVSLIQRKKRRNS